MKVTTEAFNIFLEGSLMPNPSGHVEPHRLASELIIFYQTQELEHLRVTNTGKTQENKRLRLQNTNLLFVRGLQEEVIDNRGDIIDTLRDRIRIREQIVNNSRDMIDTLRDRIRIQEQMVQLDKTTTDQVQFSNLIVWSLVITLLLEKSTPRSFANYTEGCRVRAENQYSVLDKVKKNLPTLFHSFEYFPRSVLIPEKFPPPWTNLSIYILESHKTIGLELFSCLVVQEMVTCFSI
ncbi:hypothetical protein FRACYDRAFT_239017 [Fragilariopsis cylindrus CCMP1102]|uniref:Uncharacterized protein n=1 Tax=Fragilariopsis cylindrus CCMP1102 TaxID=635003 RepID=A0A1E7FF53_9STRA|nr:hypothetical protein FRACYDRAFT_239017 [Fragilariopsis cylindrus CCMP1102]|eukprot:OEU16423.1 hypothetical protein FRACYDRAFT_239017 [Fragilariopsis cylindrus CCMP1102]